jgi:hypothetical protein
MPTSSKAARCGAPVGSGALLWIAALGAFALLATEAAAVSERVKRACERDYKRFCPSYTVGSSELRSCMSSKRRALSKRCTDALVDAGEVPRPKKP